MKRYFEFVDTKSSKFWEVWIEDSTVFTRFGKIGANGQTTVKEFPSADAAQAALDKSVAEKLKKGYLESGEAPSANQNTAPAPGKAADADPVDRWNSEELFEIAMESPMSRALFARKSSSVPIISTLFRDGALLGLLAKNPNTPVDILTTLAGDEDFNVRRGAAKNPNTPVDILTRLAKDDHDYVRWGVAENPKAPADILTTLAEDEHGNTRLAVAKNPNTPVDLLTTLSNDYESPLAEAVRSTVANNPTTPVDLLATLARDDNVGVRAGVAENPNTSEALLAALAEDGFRPSIARNPSTPGTVLITLAQEIDHNVRMDVAENPNAPVNILTALAGDDEDQVRLAVAKNPNTPVNILTTLAEKASFQQSVAENPNTPISLLASLFKNNDQPVHRGVARKPQVADKVSSTISEDDDKSPNDNPKDGTNPVTDLIDQAKQGLSILEQLIEDMEDEEFHTLPPGEWEAKNGRDKDGFPLK